MGWDPVEEIGDSVGDFVSSVGDFLSDPSLDSFGGIIEDSFKAAVEVFSLGTFSYVEEQIEQFVADLIPERDYKDRKRTVRSAVANRQAIYGTVRTGGQLAYAATDGKDNTRLWLLFILAGHKCESVPEVYVDDVLVFTYAGNKQAMNRDETTKFDKNMTAWAVVDPNGTAFFPAINADFENDAYDVTNAQPPGWTTDHVLNNQTFVWVHLTYEKDVYSQTGIPKFEFVVQGKDDLHDPRDGQPKFTDNAALVVLDLLRWDRMLGLSDSEIDMASFSEAANICDEQVDADTSGSTTEPRYTANGTFQFQTSPAEVIKSVSRACAGTVVYSSQGSWYMQVGAYESPVLSLDEDDLVGGLKFQPGPPKSRRVNAAKGTFIDPDQNYDAVGFNEIQITQYVNEDKEVLDKSYDFPWTNSPTMARRLAKIDIERSRYGVTASAVFKFKALEVLVGDRINLTVSDLGWNPKVFRVVNVEYDFSTGVRLDLREDDAAIYDWQPGDALVVQDPPAINVPNEGVAVSAPTDLSATDELYQTITRSAVKTKMIVTWDDQPGAEAYDIQFRETGSPDWIDAATNWDDNRIEIRDVDDVEHDIRVRAINSLLRKSEWSEITYDVIGKSAPPPNVPTLFVEKRILKWSLPNAPLDLDGYLVRFHNGNRRTWVDATPAHEGILTETRFPIDEFSGTKTFLVKAVDTTGNVSNQAAVLVSSLGDPVINNVIVTQNEAPDWEGTESETYAFNVISGSVPDKFNIVFQSTEEAFNVQSSASYTNAFVNSSNELEAVEVGGFYSEGGDLFYSQDSSIVDFQVVDGGVAETFEVVVNGTPETFQVNQGVDFYSARYLSVEYRWYFTVVADDVGSSLTVSSNTSNVDNEEFRYIPPGFTASSLAFPGTIEAEIGQYEFIYKIPAQTTATAPTVIDITTSLDVEDVEERLGDVSISASGTRLSLSKTYRDIVVVNLTLQDDGGTAETARVIDKDETLGPLVRAYDSSGSQTSATIDAIVQGF